MRCVRSPQIVTTYSEASEGDADLEHRQAGRHRQAGERHYQNLVVQNLYTSICTRILLQRNYDYHTSRWHSTVRDRFKMVTTDPPENNQPMQVTGTHDTCSNRPTPTAKSEPALTRR